MPWPNAEVRTSRANLTLTTQAIATATATSLPILQAVAAFLDYWLGWKVTTGAGAPWEMKEAMMLSTHEALGSMMM